MNLMQGELFHPAELMLREAMIGADGRGPLLVIGCSREKLSTATSARDLYRSHRFQSCLALARSLAIPFVILSGKFGVVEPDQVVEPYDLDLADLPEAERRSWAETAIDQLALQAKGRKVSVLAAETYARPLIEANLDRRQPLPIVAPWLKLEASDLPVWLLEADRMAARIRDLDRLYGWLASERDLGRIFQFAELSKSSLPGRGVYVFLDPAEPNFRGLAPRVVRIGTHGVSAGSKASLRGRLRTHLGGVNEIGNHRASIFRLHVGRAMLESGPGHASLATWGQGQDATREVKDAERAHEIAVTRYLQRLEVAIFEITDEPSKDSMRAQAEMQLIALFSDTMRPVDLPAPEWLGSRSPVSLVRQSGLWNVRGVGGMYDPSGNGSVANLLEA